jgi:type III secretion protein SpaR/YscT/HrcT
MERVPEILTLPWQDTDAMNLLILSQVLVGARILAFLGISPFFSKRVMGRTVRVGFMIALSVILVPGVFGEFRAAPSTAVIIVPLVLKELVLGLVLGMLVWLPIRGLEFAGVLLDTQRGSTTAQDFDVIFNAQTTPTAILIAQLFSGFFFASGGFLMTQLIIFDSYQIWPASEMLPPLTEETYYLFGRFAGVLIFTSVVFALPISGFMFMADVAIAFVARSAPTLNALTFGMPVKSAIMLIMLNFYIDVAYPTVMLKFSEALKMTERVFTNER